MVSISSLPILAPNPMCPKCWKLVGSEMSAFDSLPPRWMGFFLSLRASNGWNDFDAGGAVGGKNAPNFACDTNCVR